MKLKVIMPILALVLSTGAAFATQMKSVKATHVGYRPIFQNGEIVDCEPDKQCTDVNTGQMCTWSVDGATELKDEVLPNLCTIPLYELPES